MIEICEIDARECEREEPGESAVVTDCLENGHPHGLFGEPSVTCPQCHDGAADLAIGQLRMQLRVLGGEHVSCPSVCLRAQPRVIDPAAHDLSVDAQFVP